MAYRYYDPNYNPDLEEYRNAVSKFVVPSQDENQFPVPQENNLFSPSSPEPPEFKVRRLFETSPNSSLAQFRQLIGQMPQREKPSLLRRIGAGFAGGLVGAGYGPKAGMEVNESIMSSPYQNKLQDWLQKVRAQQSIMEEERAQRTADTSGLSGVAAIMNAQNRYNPQVTEKNAAARTRGEYSVKAPAEAARETQQQTNRIGLQNLKQEGNKAIQQMREDLARDMMALQQEGYNTRDAAQIAAANDRNRRTISSRERIAAAGRALHEKLANKSQTGISVNAEMAARQEAESIARMRDPLFEYLFETDSDGNSVMLSDAKAASEGLPDKFTPEEIRTIRNRYFDEVHKTVNEIVRSARGR